MRRIINSTYISLDRVRRLGRWAEHAPPRSALSHGS
jgi:hypothetical protein